MFGQVGLAWLDSRMQEDEQNAKTSPMTEEEILAITIGGRKPHNGPIVPAESAPQI